MKLVFIILSLILAVVTFNLIYTLVKTPKDAVAQYELAKTFDDGGSAELDYKRALKLYKLSADQGYAEAQNALGLMYYYGTGVKESNLKALEFFKKSAVQGSKYGQNNLADMYHHSETDVEQDYLRAAELYQRATAQGYAPAEYSLGTLYEYGNGVKKDHKKAVELYQKAASKNNDDALYQLAKLYKEGQIVEKNYGKSIEFYKKLSKQPSDYQVEAFEELAVFYDEGRGVSQDHDAADKLYKKATKLHYDETRKNVDPRNKNILKLGRKSLKLTLTARKTASFLGTKPKVFSHFEWPQEGDVPLTFIGQLDLGEINKNEAIPWLPKTGRLLFFYNIFDQPWGIYPKEQRSSVVLYDEGVGDLHIQEYPTSLKKVTNIDAIKYLRADDLISYPSANMTNRIDFSSNDAYESYYTFLDEYYIGPVHQVDGYPSTIQSDTMENSCQDIDFANTSRKSLEDDWKLLLQFDTDDDIDVMWGDVGRLYFWIKESDARKGVFSHTCVILQSH